MTKRHRIILLIVGVVFALGTTYWFCKNDKFDKEKWQDQKSIQKTSWFGSSRQKMVRSMLRQIDNKSRVDIIEMLGTPSRDYPTSPGQILIYVLGPEKSLFSIDMECLQLTFDKQGILEHYDIYNS